jgi:hypothetical protein
MSKVVVQGKILRINLVGLVTGTLPDVLNPR